MRQNGTHVQILLEMLDYLEQSGISDRQLRLLSVVCCRLISKVLADSSNSKALEVADQFARGQADANQLVEARRGVEECQNRIRQMHFANAVDKEVALRASSASGYATLSDAKVGVRKTLDQTARVLTLLSVERWDEKAAYDFQSLMNVQLSALAALLRENHNPFAKM